MQKWEKNNWHTLEVTHESPNQVKEFKISLLVQKNELFKMDDDKTIFEIVTRSTNIVNDLKAFGRNTSVKLLDRSAKLSDRFQRKWNQKILPFLGKGPTKLDLDQLIGPLITLGWWIRMWMRRRRRKISSWSISNVHSWFSRLLSSNS